MQDVVVKTLDTIPAHARVWVYKSAVAFTPEQRERILSAGRAFIATWAAHGAALDACVDVLHDRFVVVAVDEEQARASGCSIDKSVHFIQAMERDLGVVLTDRMVVHYEHDGSIKTCRVPDVEGMLRSGGLTGDTMVYDDLVSNVGELGERFRTHLRDTWMVRYL